ncbi:hypothetical protein [Nodosilinea sp. FACHB-13]|uniref:hypothetical protein n=1 Tax=Cyanophyceae TaxID=3028117 RepID=UPI0018F033DF|nr:hypothetical protein [Nodosilinea sp. FACHB-13]
MLALAIEGCSLGPTRGVEPINPALKVPALTAPQNLAVELETPRPEPATVWQHLQQADGQLYAVLLRHALAPGTGDPANFRLDDCTTQRNLSTEGQDQARRIGAAFRQRDIAVVQVLSSQWCRSLDTATLMDLGPVEPFEPLNSFFSDRSPAAEQTAQIRDYLRRQPDRGVIVMVTHQVNITALTGVVPGSGQAVVVTLDEARNLVQVGLLDAGE